MKVSIIMPSYNSAATIGKSIESVLEQSYKDWELIISDDCSNDDIVSVVKVYQDQGYDIKLLRNDDNLGSGPTRNRAISIASGKYIAFLDSDDLWLPNKLSIQITYMKENDIAFSFTSYRKFDFQGQRGEHIVSSKVTYKQLLKSNPIGCLTVVYDCEKIGKCYMPALRRKQDYALWLNILDKYDIDAFGIPEVLAEYCCSGGVTSNKLDVIKDQWRFYRNHLKFGFVRSTYYFFFYATSGLKKYLK
ncbi:glycosyltransferase family 2 protein [Vibrio gallaecicus]|uniref:Glycosyltransferase family 2 protein n=1 Tax=Vibrio gallaecicus TaxID=552386 RepID=A0ABV4NB96_9VIBR